MRRLWDFQKPTPNSRINFFALPLWQGFVLEEHQMKAPSLLDVHALDEREYNKLDAKSKSTLSHYMENSHQHGVVIKFKNLKNGRLLHGPLYLIEKPLNVGNYLILVSFNSHARTNLLAQRDEFLQAESVKHHEQLTLDIQKNSKDKLRPTVINIVALFCFCFLMLSSFALYTDNRIQVADIAFLIHNSGASWLCLIASVVWGFLHYVNCLVPLNSKTFDSFQVATIGKSLFKEVKIHD